MENMVDIKVVIDEKYVDPMVEIYTKRKTKVMLHADVSGLLYLILNM